jgi:predicted transcriptional regulator
MNEHNQVANQQTPDAEASQPEGARVFELAAELFSVLSTPMRLRILSALCNEEKSVSQMLTEIDTTQPNLSQHLNVLYRCGVLAKRLHANCHRDGLAVGRPSRQASVGSRLLIVTSIRHPVLFTRQISPF